METKKKTYVVIHVITKQIERRTFNSISADMKKKSTYVLFVVGKPQMQENLKGM